MVQWDRKGYFSLAYWLLGGFMHCRTKKLLQKWFDVNKFIFPVQSKESKAETMHLVSQTSVSSH